MPCGTVCLGLPTSALTVALATFCTDWIHKNQAVPHTRRAATQGKATNALRLQRDSEEGLDALLFCACGD